MVSVSVDEAPEFTEVGANAPDTPAGAPLSESATLWAFPVVTAVLIVVWVWVPCAVLTDDGDALIEKSFAGVTVSDTVVECVADGPVPVTVSVELPAAAPDPTVSVNVDHGPA